MNENNNRQPIIHVTVNPVETPNILFFTANEVKHTKEDGLRIFLDGNIVGYFRDPNWFTINREKEK